MSSRYYFVMVGREDNPLYQRGFSCKEANDSENKYYYEFIAHASLDLVDEHVWQTDHMYLKTIDKFNDMMVSAFVTPTGIKFLMVHDSKNEEGIKKFFSSVYELFIKYSLNPFYKINTPINNYAEIPGFLIIKTLAAKHVASKKHRVHVLSYESSGRDMNLDGVEVHSCYQDPLAWISGKDQEKPSLLKDLEHHIGKQDEDVIVIIDSLTHLLHNSDLCRDFNKIINQHGPVQVKQFVCLLHEDGIAAEARSAMRSLLNLFRTHVDMLGEDRISMVHKKNSGKILSEENKIWWSAEQGGLESSAVDVVDYLQPPTSAPDEPSSTFNLGLSQSEKQARDQLVLPYVTSGRESEARGGGMIYIEPEDYDEEDPDDDLDV